ncbi:MAG: hypothetical protein ACOX5K_05025, partial [Bacteroidales bacterium]
MLFKVKVLFSQRLKEVNSKILGVKIMSDKFENINDGSGYNEGGYNKIESWDRATIEEMSSIYKRVLELIGEDPGREGLRDTPVRVAKAL